MRALTRFAQRHPVPRGPERDWPPRKGTYTQCVCVLFDDAPSLAALERKLSGSFEVLKRVRAKQEEAEGWAFGGPSLVLDYRKELNGLVQVDVVDRPWPDGMGDPKGETMLFGAWTMGFFGPSTFPGALQRAMHQDWAWKEARAVAPRHRAFLRVRLSYVFGAEPDQPVSPETADPIDELRFVTQVQVLTSALPGALCGFNPNGELLLPAEHLERILERDLDGGGLAVDAWVNVRLFRDDTGAGGMLFDTVGMSQLEVRDHQVRVPEGHPHFQRIPPWLRAVSAYDAEAGGVIAPGNTTDGFDGKAWRARLEEEGAVSPPRPVLTWEPFGE